MQLDASIKGFHHVLNWSGISTWESGECLLQNNRNLLQRIPAHGLHPAETEHSWSAIQCSKALALKGHFSVIHFWEQGSVVYSGLCQNWKTRTCRPISLNFKSLTVKPIIRYFGMQEMLEGNLFNESQVQWQLQEIQERALQPKQRTAAHIR